MTQQRDIVLLLGAESEIDAGLSLLEQAYDSSGYDSEILVLGDNPKMLLEQVKSRIQKQAQAIANKTTVSESTAEPSKLIAALKSNTALRMLLIPGLDQVAELHRQLLKSVDVAVVCYQTHQNICQPAQIDIMVDSDSLGSVRSLRQLLGVERPLRRSKLETLIKEAKHEAATRNESSNGDAPVATKASSGGDAQLNGEPTFEPWYYLSSTSEDWESRLRQAKSLMEAVRGPVLLVRSEKGWSRRALRVRWLRQVIQLIPQMEREQRVALSEELNRESRPSFDFLALICASSFLAAFGLAQDSAAVIIGAMLVAPLMSPILAAGLALAQGNRMLFAQSLRTLVIGFLAALGAGAVFGFLMQAVPNTILKYSDDGYVLTSEMWSRTFPGPLDFLVGLVGGSAAAFARTRRELSSALAGAAIAAALVPPIATAGIELSLYWRPIQPPEGHELSNLVFGPSLLFFANMLTIMIGASFVLWACGIRSVHDHSSKERWTIRMIALLSTVTILVFVWIVQHSQ